MYILGTSMLKKYKYMYISIFSRGPKLSSEAVLALQGTPPNSWSPEPVLSAAQQILGDQRELVQHHSNGKGQSW